jgi:hypothetical protein
VVRFTLWILVYPFAWLVPHTLELRLVVYAPADRSRRIYGVAVADSRCIGRWRTGVAVIAGARRLGLSDLEYRQAVQLTMTRAELQGFVAQKSA